MVSLTSTVSEASAMSQWIKVSHRCVNMDRATHMIRFTNGAINVTLDDGQIFAVPADQASEFIDGLHTIEIPVPDPEPPETKQGYAPPM
jgi:hypothetical protein